MFFAVISIFVSAFIIICLAILGALHKKGLFLALSLLILLISFEYFWLLFESFFSFRGPGMRIGHFLLMLAQMSVLAGLLFFLLTGRMKRLALILFGMSITSSFIGHFFWDLYSLFKALHFCGYWGSYLLLIFHFFNRYIRPGGSLRRLLISALPGVFLTGLLFPVLDFPNFQGIEYRSMGFIFLNLWGCVFLVWRLADQSVPKHDIRDYIRQWQLTPREEQIFFHLVKNRTYKEIAADLGVTDETIKSHVKNLYRKTGAKGRQELKSWLP